MLRICAISLSSEVSRDERAFTAHESPGTLIMSRQVSWVCLATGTTAELALLWSLSA